MKIFQWNFQGLLKTSSANSPEILVKNSPSVVDKLQCVQWDIFEPPDTHTRVQISTNELDMQYKKS